MDFDDLAISSTVTQNTFHTAKTLRSRILNVIHRSFLCGRAKKSSNSRQIAENCILKTELICYARRYITSVDIAWTLWIAFGYEHGQWRVETKSSRTCGRSINASFTAEHFGTMRNAFMFSTHSDAAININKNPFARSYVAWLLSMVVMVGLWWWRCRCLSLFSPMLWLHYINVCCQNHVKTSTDAHHRSTDAHHSPLNHRPREIWPCGHHCA